MKLLAAGATNVGMKRTHNEDCLIQVPEENLFVVADGMGGHERGDVAAQLACNVLKENLMTMNLLVQLHLKL